jgi:hypothetical protein
MHESVPVVLVDARRQEAQESGLLARFRVQISIVQRDSVPYKAGPLRFPSERSCAIADH